MSARPVRHACLDRRDRAVFGPRRDEPVLAVEWRCHGTRRRAAGGPEGQSDVLCLGDSRIKLGILPRVLHDRLGVSAYNLGMLGGQAPSSYFLLKRVLESGNRPRAILVDFSENLLAFSPSGNAACWSDWIGWRESLDVTWQSRIPPWRSRPRYTASCPVGATRANEVLCSASARRTAAGTRSADDPSVFERNWRLNRGAQVAPRAFVPVEETPTEPVEAGVLIRQMHVTSIDCCALAQAYGIAVYWILPPSSPGAASDWSETA